MSELIENKNLVVELKSLIASTKEQVAISVNSSLTLMYWQIGYKINEDILKNSRAEYGNEIVHAVSRQLVEEFGSGFSRANLFHMIKFSQVFDDFEIVSTLSRQLSWSHFKEIMYMDDSLEERQKISKYLDEKLIHFDNTIEKTKQTIKKLKEAKEALISQAGTGKIEVL